MKKVFVKTNNVKRFITMMNNLQNRGEGVPGMGLVYGEPGLGKTYGIMWWAMQNDAIYIRCANMMTSKWLLEEIAEELGEIPYMKTSDTYNQVINHLLRFPKIILVDEIDYLTSDTRTIETLRDIHDKTNVPIVFIGMAHSNRQLMRYKHLYDRLSEILKFQPFSKSDILKIIDEISEVEITQDAKEFICTKTKRFRQIVKMINKAEQIAKSNGINSIDETTIKEFINNDAEEFDSNNADSKVS